MIRLLQLLKTLLFIFVVTRASMSMADTPSNDLSQLLNSVKTMQANFTQLVGDNHGKIIQRSYGKMAFERPGRFRWDITKPIPQLIIANQSRLWIYDPDLQQVTIRSLKHAAGDAPALLLSHEEGVLDQRFRVSQLPYHQSGMQWFSLTPKKSDNFASIQMGFLKGKISEMRLQDNLGHMTKISFTNIRSNISISANLFQFKSSSHIDVIDETRRN